MQEVMDGEDVKELGTPIEICGFIHGGRKMVGDVEGSGKSCRGRQR